MTRGNAPKEGGRTNVREVVLDACLEILENGAYSHLVLSQALEKYQYLEKQDRAFITRVTEGTVEHLLTLDAAVGRFSKVKVGKMKPVIRTILRMSVYQLLYMDRVPDSAVCNEAVKLAKARRLEGLSGFVNGVLRTISREKGALVFDEPSVRLSMPEWILSMWGKSYGREKAEAIAEAFFGEQKLAVRINRSRAARETVIRSLESQKISVEETKLSDSVLFLSGYDYLEQVEAFQNGWITVQDLSSSLVCAAASPKAGDFVLDLCAAPGGKSLHMADLLGDGGFVEARDLTESKVELIRQNIARSGMGNIRAKVWDARVFDQDMEERADVVLADLPCSGLGVIGKKPDIKLRVQPEDLDKLAALQREILSNAARYVKPGGTLVYSTCTIDGKENEENASWFLEHFPFRAGKLEERMPQELRGDCSDGRLQLLPGKHPCDGFFIAVFEKATAGRA